MLVQTRFLGFLFMYAFSTSLSVAAYFKGR